MMLDYRGEFHQDIVARLAEAGCRQILLFDLWHEREPSPGIYVFDPLVKYARVCRAAGIELLVQTPIGAPLWCPSEWFLRNAEGQRSDFLQALARFPAGLAEKIGFERSIALGLRILSYWNTEAESYLRGYIQRLRSVIEPEGATCISSIGACGEYLFPSVYFYGFLGVSQSPWWHDTDAEQSWNSFNEKRPGSSRTEWLWHEVCEISRVRLELYEQKWLQYVPYFQGWGNFGNDGIDHVLAQNAPGLRTILFTVFRPEFLETAAAQAAKYPTWGGAEGAANVVTNSRLAHELGLRGVICGPLWFNYASEFEPWMFDNLREASTFWNGVNIN